MTVASAAVRHPGSRRWNQQRSLDHVGSGEAAWRWRPARQRQIPAVLQALRNPESSVASQVSHARQRPVQPGSQHCSPPAVCWPLPLLAEPALLLPAACGRASAAGRPPERDHTGTSACCVTQFELCHSKTPPARAWNRRMAPRGLLTEVWNTLLDGSLHHRTGTLAHASTRDVSTPAAPAGVAGRPAAVLPPPQGAGRRLPPATLGLRRTPAPVAATRAAAGGTAAKCDAMPSEGQSQTSTPSVAQYVRGGSHFPY